MRTQLLTNLDIFILALAGAMLITLLAIAFRKLWQLLDTTFFNVDEPDYFDSIDWQDIAKQIKRQAKDDKYIYDCDAPDYVVIVTLDWWSDNVYIVSITAVDENGYIFDITNYFTDDIHKYLDYDWFQ